MAEGTVKFYSELKGFGFIERADGADLFFHVTALPEGADLPGTGDRVSFEVGANPRDGRPRAEAVRVIA
jgi:CspA family cold shock protein